MHSSSGCGTGWRRWTIGAAEGVGAVGQAWRALPCVGGCGHGDVCLRVMGSGKIPALKLAETATATAEAPKPMLINFTSAQVCGLERIKYKV